MIKGAESSYKDRKYTIQAYCPQWPEQFRERATELKTIFGGDALAIEHIGSTSVPGMYGKPTIDILILVDDLIVVDKHVPAMEEDGYKYLPNFVMPGSKLFRRIKDGVLLSNVHIFEKDHPHVQEMLGLRNYLRFHPDEVKIYSTLKRELFQKYPTDYATYRKLKDEYMEKLKSRILRRKHMTVHASGLLEFDGHIYRCALGRTSIKVDKQEGDGATPQGDFSFRKVLYRADRIPKPATGLPVESIDPKDSWCDDPQCQAYNTQIKIPHTGSFEPLFRTDDLYDIVAVIGYNDAPPVPGKGSAIFLHVARPDYAPTDGCIALKKEDLLEVLSGAGPDTRISVNG